MSKVWYTILAGVGSGPLSPMETEEYRPMPIAIAIDGPAGAGKSTLAKGVAKALDILYLDTGAMYRSVGLFMLRRGINPADSAAVADALPHLQLRVAYENGGQRVYLEEQDVTDRLRTPEIDAAATAVAAIAPVRVCMVDMQRAIAKGQDIVMDGRDIGTKVLPHASVKVFCTAHVSIRAQRRYEERLAKGLPADYDEILSEMRQRDENDSTRAASPLVQAEDATVLDSTQMDPQACIDFVVRLAQQARKETTP